MIVNIIVSFIIVLISIVVVSVGIVLTVVVISNGVMGMIIQVIVIRNVNINVVKNTETHSQRCRFRF